MENQFTHRFLFEGVLGFPAVWQHPVRKWFEEKYKVLNNQVLDTSLNLPFEQLELAARQSHACHKTLMAFSEAQRYPLFGIN